MGHGKFPRIMQDFFSDVNQELFEWSDVASCRGLHHNYFFDLYESNRIIAKNIDELCVNCPVRQECFQSGSGRKETGVWGGFYLVNGEIDTHRNSHKNKFVWDKLNDGYIY